MLRLLVIEAAPVGLALSVAALEEAGHVVLQAERAALGVDVARREQPDLVLVDIHLPGTDGLQAARLLKSDPRTAQLPVIALTAFAIRGGDAEARAAGCDGVVTQPIRYKEFAAVVDAVMRRRTLASR